MTLVLLIPAVILLPEQYGMLATAFVAGELILRRLCMSVMACSSSEIAVGVFLAVTLFGLLQLSPQAFLGFGFYAVSALSSLVVLASWRFIGDRHYRWSIEILVWIAVLEASLILKLWVDLGHPAPEDWAHVLTDNAHISGFILVLAGTYVLGRIINRHYFPSVFFLPLLATAFYMTATKQALVAFLAGLAFLTIIKLRRLDVFVCCCAIILYSVFPLASFLASEWEARGADVPKVQGYVRTVKMMSDFPIGIMTGVGAGMYGSRAAVSRADPSDLPKPEGQKIPAAFVGTPPLLKLYLADLYSPGDYENLLLTGTYYTPFSTWNSVLAELGLVGVIALMGLFVVLIRASLGVMGTSDFGVGFVTCIASVAFVVVFLYDNWLEYPRVMVPFALFAGYSCKLHWQR